MDNQLGSFFTLIPSHVDVFLSGRGDEANVEGCTSIFSQKDFASKRVRMIPYSLGKTALNSFILSPGLLDT